MNIPKTEDSIVDLAWNPVDRHRFAAVTATGSVHMFSVNLLQKPHINPSGYLPASVQAHCRECYGHPFRLFDAFINSCCLLAVIKQTD